MANVTVTSAANFIPEIWAQRALQALRANVVLAKLVSRDTAADAFTVGDTLHIPVPGTFTANDKAAGGNVTTQVPTDSAVTLVLNKHKEVTFLIEDAVRAQQNQDVMDRYLSNAVIPLAEAIENDIFALYSGFSTTVGTTGTDLTATSIRSARKALNDNKAPKAGRFMVVSDKDEISILGDSNLSSYFAFSQPEAVREGSSGRVYGFDLYQSQLVPTVAGTPVSTKNIAGTPEFGLLAMRGLPESGNPGVEQMNVTDPESGLTLRQTISYNPNALGVQITLDVLYGVVELRDACGVTVLS